MKRYLALVVLLAVGAAGATPMHSSREKPNALGFHQHQPKSSLHGYASPPLVADTTPTGENSATGATSITTPPPAPGRIGPTDKTPSPPVGPGRIDPVDKTRTEPPEFCTTQRIGGPPQTPWGCGIKGPPKELPEPGTYALLAVGLMALWLQRSMHRPRIRRARSTDAPRA